MEKRQVEHPRVGTGMLVIAVVLLAGVLVLAGGYAAHNRIALYAGLMVTLAGVLTGIWRLLLRGEH
jgi:hypothetical protein